MGNLHTDVNMQVLSIVRICGKLTLHSKQIQMLLTIPLRLTVQVISPNPVSNANKCHKTVPPPSQHLSVSHYSHQNSFFKGLRLADKGTPSII